MSLTQSEASQLIEFELSYSSLSEVSGYWAAYSSSSSSSSKPESVLSQHLMKLHIWA